MAYIEFVLRHHEAMQKFVMVVVETPMAYGISESKHTCMQDVICTFRRKTPEDVQRDIACKNRCRRYFHKAVFFPRKKSKTPALMPSAAAHSQSARLTILLRGVRFLNGFVTRKTAPPPASASNVKTGSAGKAGKAAAAVMQDVAASMGTRRRIPLWHASMGA